LAPNKILTRRIASGMRFNLKFMRTVLSFILLLVISGVFLKCSPSKPVKSTDDLKEAFNSKSTSAQKYASYAQVAMREGYDTLAQLFNAISKSESILASNHEKVFKKFGENGVDAVIGKYDVKATSENLQAAINSETSEIQTMYTRFIRDSEDEKAPEAAKTFLWAMECGKRDLKYNRKAAAIIANGNEITLPYTWLICPSCGNICTATDIKDKCDFCLTNKENFIGYIEKTE
jgi:rubrerythrin